MNKSISILLGAGFSAPMGYPIGDSLNRLILESEKENFAFYSGGSLVISTDGKKPDLGWKSSYQISYEFCVALMKYFNDLKGYFDYEEFYDFMKDGALTDPKVAEVAKPFLFEFKTVDQLIYSLDNIYAQVISYFLKDHEGKTYYDDAPTTIGNSFYPYTGILNCLKKFSENFAINVHTLNHDLVFERFDSTELLGGKICDGFEELGSPYYGKLLVSSRGYKVRLERFTGRYLKSIKLFKLHGSRDYGIYYTSNGGLATAEVYLKKRYGVGFIDLYKEKVNPETKELEYENCWINYHADFLTGTTSKILRYTEPLFYKNLFASFKQNLKDAEILLIIGYGAKDKEINKILMENFNHKSKQCFIIDPYAGEKVNELAQQLNAIIINKHMENIQMSDLEKATVTKESNTGA